MGTKAEFIKRITIKTSDLSDDEKDQLLFAVFDLLLAEKTNAPALSTRPLAKARRRVRLRLR